MFDVIFFLPKSCEKRVANTLRRIEDFHDNRSAAMHELGIAQNILEIVRQAVPEEQTPSVRWIRIRVGQLAGVVPDSLDFCFSAIVSETKMAQAGLAIEQVPTVSRCKDCRHQFEIEDMLFLCPACKGTNLEMVSGHELEIVEIELEDDKDEAL
jgi:hydrogenase nickel incorporation protein HypA/HybF